jgi:uncharacterized hydrophobic protein (TIGR00271 family)
MRALSALFDPSDVQHVSLEEVEGTLFLNRNGRLTARTPFWLLLVLAAIIASAGIVENSTATVVGAMIIAPLGTPIFGCALAVVEGHRRQMVAALEFMLTGVLAAIAVGAIIGWATATRLPIEANPQVTARTAPTLLDLLIALATGTAGAYGLTRRDVASVLPGVAIAISLVPPLAVVGITLGAGMLSFAVGALLLFAANALAIVLSGIAVFTLSGYRSVAQRRDPSLGHQAGLAIALAVIMLVVPLALASASEVDSRCRRGSSILGGGLGLDCAISGPVRGGDRDQPVRLWPPRLDRGIAPAGSHGRSGSYSGAAGRGARSHPAVMTSRGPPARSALGERATFEDVLPG